MTSVIDGLASGLDTTSIITNLMKIEAAPQTRLKTKSAASSTLVTALQALNTKVATLATTATKAASTTAWQVSGVTSSSTAVTATTTSSAVPSSVQLRVDRLAAGQVSMVDLSSASLGSPPTLTIVRGSELVTVTAAGSDALALAAAINASADAGITAVPIRVGDSAGGTPEYRLQLTGPIGADGAFEVYVGDEATVSGYVTDTGDGYEDNGTAPAGARLASSAAALVAAADAQVTFWPGAGSAVTATSPTNTFDGVVQGVQFTVSATTTADPPITLSVAADRASQRALVEETVNALKGVFDDIAAQTTTKTTTDGDGRSVVSGGLFTGESTVRFVGDRLRAALMNPVGGASPSSIGISIDRYGALTFDAEAFDAAMADDPAGTQATAQAIAQRVADVADAASDKIDGSLTRRIATEQSVVTDLTRQIADWDRRLEIRRSTLEATYTALEVALSQLQSQSSWLSSQLAGLDNLAASAAGTND